MDKRKTKANGQSQNKDQSITLLPASQHRPIAGTVETAKSYDPAEV
jgi:hypothetical protein